MSDEKKVTKTNEEQSILSKAKNATVGFSKDLIDPKTVKGTILMSTAVAATLVYGVPAAIDYFKSLKK